MAQSSDLFREKTLDRISSPDDLNDYLKVTSPRMWAVLIAVVVFLVGLLAWSSVGTLATKADATVVVTDGSAAIRLTDAPGLQDGMKVTVQEPNGPREFVVESVDDVNGEEVGHASVGLADGTYEAVVVTDETPAIDFLLKSN